MVEIKGIVCVINTANLPRFSDNFQEKIIDCAYPPNDLFDISTGYTRMSFIAIDDIIRLAVLNIPRNGLVQATFTANVEHRRYGGLTLSNIRI